MTFSDFIGNKQVVQTLRQAANGGRLSHAYLLHGANGTGKRSLLALFARALLCTSSEEHPCGTCPACYKASHGIHPDCTVIRPPEGKTLIPVDAIRQMREDLYIRPNEAQWKIVIIEQCELMNASAANALLKVLEEPPRYAIFLLSAESLGALPETIASRCVCLELREPTHPQALLWLQEKYPDESPEALSAAIRYSGGNLGESMRYLEEETVREQAAQALALAEALTAYREYDLLAALAPIEGSKDRFLRLLRDFDRLIGQVVVSPYRQPTDESLCALAQHITPARAAEIHNCVSACIRKLKLNGSIALLPSLFSAQLKTVMEQIN